MIKTDGFGGMGGVEYDDIQESSMNDVSFDLIYREYDEYKK